MNKKNCLIILLIFTFSCSYVPILSNKAVQFYFSDIKIIGDQKVGEKVKNNLLKKSKGEKKYEIKLISEKNKNVVARNKQGDPSLFELKINLNYSVFEKDEIILQKDTSKKITYNNKPDKFELFQYERNIIDNLVEAISNEIIIEVSRLNK